MKAPVALAFSLSVAASLSATAQPSSRNAKAPFPGSKATAVGGVETIKPQEQPSKDEGDVNGWDGSYFGVNAGMGFGATAGTNLIVPLGTGEGPNK